MTKPDAVRVSSRHFFWYDLAWSRGNRPTLVFKDGAHIRPTYMLHSNSPTYAGEQIVDPARVDCISPRETRLRVKAPTREPLSDISNLNHDDVRATQAGGSVGIKRRRSAPAVICSHERAQHTRFNSFEQGRPAEETYRVVDESEDGLDRGSTCILRRNTQIDTYTCTTSNDIVFNSCYTRLRRRTDGSRVDPDDNWGGLETGVRAETLRDYRRDRSSRGDSGRYIHTAFVLQSL